LNPPPPSLSQLVQERAMLLLLPSGTSTARRSCEHPYGGKAMKVNTAMTRNVRLVSPDQTIREAAQLMAEIDAGSLPVGENDRLVGMITDRDIAIRAVAEGKAPETKIRDVMSHELLYCLEDQDLSEVSRNMGKNKVRRLPV